MTICLDSSAWIEIFTLGTNAETFAKASESATRTIVTSISIYEVRWYALARSDEETANAFWSTLIAHDVIDFTADLAAAAADIAQAHKLAIADAIILATARENNATLWTQDADFERLDGVRNISKKSA